MGLFDSFYFADGVLPQNKVEENYEFQTKDLSCNLDKYYVDKQGFVTMTPFREEGDEKVRPVNAQVNDTVFVYSHKFTYKNKEGEIEVDPEITYDKANYGCKYQCYKLVILQGRVSHVEKVDDKDEVYKRIEEG